MYASCHDCRSSWPDPADSPRLPGHGPAGLRERKKLATRKALGMAAMRLAVQRGLDNVLIDDIAAEAGVSPRTFSNYFSSKYEAICALAMDRSRQIGAALRARPAGEPLWDAITHAVLQQASPPTRRRRRIDHCGVAQVSSPGLQGRQFGSRRM